jgi:hypothetical protein
MGLATAKVVRARQDLGGIFVISRGSEWHRWEPHIHAPGTILNNQFGAIDPWGAYLTALEGLTPRIEAIAVTDYYVADTYEEFLKHKGGGRLPGVHLLFPNIELRLDVAAKSGFVNIHLLVSPEDPEHLSEAKRILKRAPEAAPTERPLSHSAAPPLQPPSKRRQRTRACFVCDRRRRRFMHPRRHPRATCKLFRIRSSFARALAMSRPTFRIRSASALSKMAE